MGGQSANRVPLKSLLLISMMRLAVFCLLAASASAVILEIKPFKRLIPADILRDFRDSCFASTQCKVFDPQETWSLAPFCGASKCVKLKSGRLAEEVTDCGPVVDLVATEGCQLVPDAADKNAAFPGCCPVYDCLEGTEVKYVNPPVVTNED